MSFMSKVTDLLAKETQIQDLISEYLSIRDQLDTSRKEFKSLESDAKGAMDLLSERLGDLGNTFGVESFKTEAGTAYKTNKEVYRVADWATFIQYVVKSENYQLLEKRVAKNAAREIYEDTGKPPAGIFHDEIPVFLVRKPTK